MRDHLERFVFIDETSLKTNMTKTSAWAPVGDRLIDHAPAGRWNPQTYIAGLRHDRIDATGVINGPMDKDMFESYVEGILAPTLRPGDIVLNEMQISKGVETRFRLADTGLGLQYLKVPGCLWHGNGGNIDGERQTGSRGW